MNLSREEKKRDGEAVRRPLKLKQLKFLLAKSSSYEDEVNKENKGRQEDSIRVL